MKNRIVFLLFLILGMLSLNAQNIIRPKVECPNGIYVNSYNGVLFYQRGDVSVMNRNMRLEAVFYYNSSSNEVNYGYGNGWSLGNELRYKNDSLGIIIEQGDGRQDLYTRYGNTFVSPAGVFSTLSIDGLGYKLTMKDGTRYFFDDSNSKKVTKEKDRYDNEINYVYSDGKLTAMTDISGRSLYFAWSGDYMVGLSTSFDTRTWSYQYDERGNLISVTNPLNQTVHYAYNKENRIKTFTDEAGYSTHVTYNTDGMAHRIKTDLTDRSIRYEQANHRTVFVDYMANANTQFGIYVWDEQGRLIEIKNVGGSTSSKFAYDSDNNVICREDGNGNATTYTYDQNGNMLSETDALGYTKYYTYESAFNNITSYKDKMGNLYTYSYNEKGDLLEEHGPLNYCRICTYDMYGQLLSEKDSNYNTTTYTYDNYGNVTSMTDPLGNVVTIGYSSDGLPVSKTNPDGAQTLFSYNILQQITKKTDPYGNETSMQYDSRGNLTAITDANSNKFDMTFDALRRTISINGPSGPIKHYLYNENGLVTQIIDALNHSSINVYDERNNLKFCIGEGNDTTYYSYDNAGNLIGSGMPNGRNIVFQYDALNRMVSVSDQFGMIASYQYDANDNLIMVTDAMGNVRHNYYDARNQLIQSTDALNQSEYYSYDACGNMLTYLDRNGNSSVYTYDANGNIVTHLDALNYLTSYTYNSNGNLASITDANGNVTTYLYNLNGKLDKITFPNGKTRRFWYDGNGNVIQQENEAGEQTIIAYDAMNRIISMNCSSDGMSNTYGYDAAGRLISAINENASIQYEYDAQGRLLSETMNDGVTSYVYNIKGRTINVTYPSGRMIQERYDMRSRLIEIIENGSPLAQYNYNSNGYIANVLYGNGISTHYGYDANMRLTQMSDNANVVDYQFTYDAEGNLISRQDGINQSNSNLYSYDQLNRLTYCCQGEMNSNYQIPNPLQQTTFNLDALGNRISVVNNDILETYSTNNMNAYTSVSGGANHHSYQYDDNGNMISDGIHSYQYNSSNRIVSVDGGNTANYKYDALNRLIQKQTIIDNQNSVVNYCFSGEKIIEERGENGILQSSFVYGQSLTDVIQMQNSHSTSYYQKDQLNSVVAMTNSNADAVEKYNYNPFGEAAIFNINGVQISSSAYGNTIMFNSQKYDNLLQSYNVAGRELNPYMGRYYQTDPLVYAGSNNLYTIPENNPTKEKNWAQNAQSAQNAVDYISVVGNVFDELNMNIGSNGVLYSNLFHGNQYVSIVGNTAKLGNVIGKAMGIVSLGFEMYNMVENVLETDMCKDEFAEYFQSFGKIVGGGLGAEAGAAIGVALGTMICPGLGTAAGLVLGTALGWIGGELGGAYMREGGELLGTLADYGLDALEAGCARFQATGYDNATQMQKWMAETCEHPRNIIRNAFNLGYHIGEALFPVK